jgi:hypothetical protein
MPHETLNQLKVELAAQFAPPLQITSRHGFRFCSPSCADEACDAWLETLLPFISSRDARLMHLMPSLFPDMTPPMTQHREKACTELLTLLIARNVRHPETWSRWISRYALPTCGPFHVSLTPCSAQPGFCCVHSRAATIGPRTSSIRLFAHAFSFPNVQYVSTRAGDPFRLVKPGFSFVGG